MTMLYMADQRGDVGIIPVLYRNSGDSEIGDKDRVVGYWAIAGHTVTPEEQAFTLNNDEKEQLLAISRATLEEYINKGELYQVSRKDLTARLKQPSGAFVSLYMGGRLRGCIGNFLPEKALYEVVQEMTIAAATHDRRFAPVEAPELNYISLEISVLTPLEKINSIDEFELNRHGIYMTRDGHSGTYLPQVASETGWSKEPGSFSSCPAGLDHCFWDIFWFTEWTRYKYAIPAGLQRIKHSRMAEAILVEFHTQVTSQFFYRVGNFHANR